jgi:hypothetical protein
MTSAPSYHYEWRLVHDGIGRVPNIRSDAASFYYQNAIWVTCGAGSGLGKSSEVWKFDLTSKLWNKVSCLPQESPEPRDGHSGTYIGEGKFVIFGGQGFSEPNKKLGKESELLKAQTYCKRDVFNDLWMFDCHDQRWKPIYPDGLSFPMGRRGHSTIYLPRNVIAKEEEERNKLQAERAHPDDGSGASYSTYSTGHSSSYHSKSTKPSSSLNKDNNNMIEPIPENALIVFGGAGIELSKYTEQIYNDVWVYSFDTNTWHRHLTRGLEPYPCTQHQAIRSGENMIIVGGIMGNSNTTLTGVNLSSSSTTTNSTHAPVAGLAPAILDGDIQVLNLRKATWSIVRVLDQCGRLAKVNSLGFSMIPDIELFHESNLFAPVQSLILFGGKESVDSRTAATTKQSASRMIMKSQSALSPNNHSSMSMLEEYPSMLGSHHHYQPYEDSSPTLTTITQKRQQSQQQLQSQQLADNLLILNLEDWTLNIMENVRIPTIHSLPEGRYAQIAVSGIAPKEFTASKIQEQLALSDKALKRNKKKMLQAFNNNNNSSKTGGNDNGNDGIANELPIMYVYGGCRLETNGYCDPLIYALYKIYHIANSHHHGTNSNLSSARTDISTHHHAASPTTSTALRSANDWNPLASMDEVMILPGGQDSQFGSPQSMIFQGDDRDRGGEEDPPIFQRDRSKSRLLLGSSQQLLLQQQQPSLYDHILQQPSIWTNVQKKEQLTHHRDITIQKPNNWEDMKLSLTSSRSLRILHNGQILGNSSSNHHSQHHSQNNNQHTHHIQHHHQSVSAFPSMISEDASAGVGGFESNNKRNHSGHNLLNSASMASSGLGLKEFTVRSLESHSRGAPYSPWNMPTTNGLDGERSPSRGMRRSATTSSTLLGDSGSSSHSKLLSSSAAALTAGSSPATTGNHRGGSGGHGSGGGNLANAMQHSAVEKELRKERIKTIKATLKPIILKQTKVIARETFNTLFPLKMD